jgi:uridine phosphorylase
LTFIRIGTCGGVQKDTPVDSFILNGYALGLDALSRMEISHTDEVSGQWYEELMRFTDARGVWLQPAYMSAADQDLVAKFAQVGKNRIAVTCAGFYGLQGRSIRLESNMSTLLKALFDFEYNDMRVGCLEMETAAIYLYARLLGHKAISLNAIIANRSLGTVSSDPYAAVDGLIREVVRILPS